MRETRDLIIKKWWEKWKWDERPLYGCEKVIEKLYIYRPMRDINLKTLYGPNKCNNRLS